MKSRWSAENSNQHHGLDYQSIASDPNVTDLSSSSRRKPGSILLFSTGCPRSKWIPAFAGMTVSGCAGLKSVAFASDPLVLGSARSGTRKRLDPERSTAWMQEVEQRRSSCRDWCGILSAAHRKHRGDGKSKWVPKPEPAASGTGSYGFVDTGGEMVTPLITIDPIGVSFPATNQRSNRCIWRFGRQANDGEGCIIGSQRCKFSKSFSVKSAFQSMSKSKRSYTVRFTDPV